MCQTLNTVFHRSSHLLPSYKKYGLRLVFRWFLGFGYSCDHQTTLYKTLNKRHTTPLTSESTMISLHSIKYHLLQSGLSLRGGDRGFPPAFMNMSPGYSQRKKRKNRRLLKIWILDENTASLVRYITYFPRWLVYSTTLDKRKLYKLPFQCPRVQTSDVVWDILICEVSTGKFHGWNTACPVWYRVFSLTWPASMQIYWHKRKRLHKKGVQLPQDWFGTPTWLPFHCFGTPIWLPWRHVNTTLYDILCITVNTD